MGVYSGVFLVKLCEILSWYTEEQGTIKKLKQTAVKWSPATKLKPMDVNS